MKKNTEAITEWDYNSFIKLFRTGEDSSSAAFKNAIAHCLRKLYEGEMEFRRVLVDGFMYSRDYAFLLDLSLPKYDDFELLKFKIYTLSIVLGFEL